MSLSIQQAKAALRSVMLEWTETALPRENLDKSIEVAGRRIDQVRHAHYAAVNLFSGLVSSLPDYPNHPVLRKHGAFVIHHWEASILSVRALVLTLHGAYHGGYALLRSLLEVVLRGAALDYIALHLRTVPKTLRRDFAKSSGIGDLFEGNRPQRLANRFERDSFPLLRFLGQARLTFAPSFHSLCGQLEEWGLTGPIEVVRAYADYDELSQNIHAQYRRTDLVRASATQRDVVFARRPLVIEPALVLYTDAHRRVADVCGVVELNLMREDLDADPSLMDYLREVQRHDGFRMADLPYLKRLLNEVVGGSRA